MTDVVFTADPTRLIISAGVGIVLLLFLIIKFKLHPVISMMISAIVIGIGAGMPLNLIAETVQKGVGKTLQGIALLIGLGSMFGGILEVSGGAQKMAQTLISKFGQKKASLALGLTGLVIGTTVFFEAGVVILIPLAFNVAKQTKKSTLLLCHSFTCRSCFWLCLCSTVSRFSISSKCPWRKFRCNDCHRHSNRLGFNNSCRCCMGQLNRK